MKYRVEITRPCQTDIDEVAIYIGEDNPVVAVEFSVEILEHIKTQLSDQPFSAPIFREKLPRHLRQYQGQLRKLVHGKNKTVITCYLANAESRTVYVLHTKRSWKPLGL